MLSWLLAQIKDKNNYKFTFTCSAIEQWQQFLHLYCSAIEQWQQFLPLPLVLSNSDSNSYLYL